MLSILQGLGLIMMKTFKVSTKALLRDLSNLTNPEEIEQFLEARINASPEKVTANIDWWLNGIGIEAAYAFARERYYYNPDFATALRATAGMYLVGASPDGYFGYGERGVDFPDFSGWNWYGTVLMCIREEAARGLLRKLGRERQGCSGPRG